MLWIKNLFLLVLVPGVAVGLVPWWILHNAHTLPVLKLDLLSLLAIVLFLCGAVTVIWVVWEFTTIGKGTPAPFDPPRHFVSRGLYRLTRNPMYTGALTMLMSEALYFRSLPLLLYACLVFLVLHLFIVLVEEPGLRKRFGTEYMDYCSSVSRWIPVRFSKNKELPHV